MKKAFNKKTQIISSIILFSISFILCHFTHLATLHGKSDAPIIVAILGVIALLISYIFNIKILTITATLGYIVSFFIGVWLKTEGIVTGDGMVHDLWIVWLTSYIIFIGLGIVFDFTKKITKQKSVMNYIGLFIGVFIVGASMTIYLTKPLTMNDVMQHKPRLTGAVLELYDDSMLIHTINSDDKIIVSLDVKMKDVSVSKYDFNIGDIVRVYYDGNIAESSPAQINNVYAVFDNEASNKQQKE